MHLFVDDSSPSGCGLGAGDEDLDGIDAAIEDGVGDGNGDGTADSAQAHVASTTDPTGGYLTIAATSDDFQLQAVTVTDPGTVPSPPAGVTGASGVVGFTVSLPADATDATIDVYLDDPGGEINSYWKFKDETWAEAPATFTPVAGGRTRATFTLTDGGAGDADGVVNGEIVDPGVFAVTDRTGPVVLCPADPQIGLNTTGAKLVVNVSDDSAGVAAPTIDVPADASIAGPRAVPVVASDVLGNTTTTDCGYRVVYGVRWLLPTNPGGLFSLQANRTTGFSFRVVDANGAGVAGRVVSAPTSQSVACPAGRPKALVGVNALPVATVTAGGGWWVAGWRPSAQWKNTCRQVLIALTDGTTQSLVVKVT